MKFVSGILVLIVVFICGCKKDSFITGPDAQISFSDDTLFYDTVFTSVGSITQVLRIYNDNDQKLKLTSVELAGSANSAFRINVDGIAGTATNLEILPNDSLYVFISVMVNPTNASSPFILQDSLRIAYNGNEKFVQLQAWGQNAHFLRGYRVTGNETWNNDKPYVLLDGLVVEENASLTINPGCRLYFHMNAPLIVEGSLIAKGEKFDSTRIYFLGDRLDAPYKDYPGSWPGIVFKEKSRDNILQFSFISNAYQGVVVEQPSVNNNPKLQLYESVIENCYDAGLLAIRTSIKSRNTLIANCGKNLAVVFGGNYEFAHLTSAAFSNRFIAHKEPVLFVSNKIEDATGVYAADLTADFHNCIFWGDDGLVQDEVVVEKDGLGPYSVTFSNSLWKVSGVSPFVTSTDMINNEDPAFRITNTDKNQYDFRLKEESPAIGFGKAAGVMQDLDGNPRKMTTPDPGAYEKQ
jgi:hypothetical protein